MDPCAIGSKMMLVKLLLLGGEVSKVPASGL